MVQCAMQSASIENQCSRHLCSSAPGHALACGFARAGGGGTRPKPSAPPGGGGGRKLRLPLAAEPLTAGSGGGGSSPAPPLLLPPPAAGGGANIPRSDELPPPLEPEPSDARKPPPLAGATFLTEIVWPSFKLKTIAGFGAWPPAAPDAVLSCSRFVCLSQSDCGRRETRSFYMHAGCIHQSRGMCIWTTRQQGTNAEEQKDSRTKAHQRDVEVERIAALDEAHAQECVPPRSRVDDADDEVPAAV